MSASDPKIFTEYIKNNKSDQWLMQIKNDKLLTMSNEKDGD